MLIIYQGCDHFVSRRYTIDNITISPSNPYATVIQDFRFSLPTSFSENASLWAVLSGKRTNAFFIALRYLLINAEGFLWFKEENTCIGIMRILASILEQIIRSAMARKHDQQRTLLFDILKEFATIKSFKSLMHKKKFII